MFRESLIPSIRGAPEMRVELDKKSLFALASDTRLDILRSLQPMRRTVTQLSESLNIDKAAVHRHLKKLEEGGLVKRYEDHGFVYYGLSWKARDLLTPNENTKIIVLLSASWIFILVALFLVIATLGTTFFGFHSTYGGDQGAEYMRNNSASGWFDFPTAQSMPWYVWGAPAIGLSIFAATFVVLGFRLLIKPKQKGPSEKCVSISNEPRLDD